MFKFVSQQGIIQDIIATTSVLTYIKIDTLSNDPILSFKQNDLQKNDAVILVGYFADDEYCDPVLYICAYFNISKNKKSRIEWKLILWFMASIATLILTVVCWNYRKGTLLEVLLLLSVIAIIVILSSLQIFIAHRILEREIKKANPYKLDSQPIENQSF